MTLSDGSKLTMYTDDILVPVGPVQTNQQDYSILQTDIGAIEDWIGTSHLDPTEMQVYLAQERDPPIYLQQDPYWLV